MRLSEHKPSQLFVFESSVLGAGAVQSMFVDGYVTFEIAEMKRAQGKQDE